MTATYSRRRLTRDVAGTLHDEFPIWNLGGGEDWSVGDAGGDLGSNGQF